MPRQTVRLSRAARRVLDGSAIEAADRGEPLTSFHVLQFLLAAAEVREALVATSVPAAELRSAVSRALADGAGTSEQNARSWQDALRATARRVAGSEAGPLGNLDLLIALAEQEDAASAEVLRLHRVDGWALKWYASHEAGRVTRPGLSGLPGRLARMMFARQSVRHGAKDDDAPGQVMVYNDHFTTKEFVVELLERTFGMSRDAAEVKMHEVHTHGHARLGPFAPDEAERLTAEASRLARTKGFPLRLSTGPTRHPLPGARLVRDT